MSNNQSVKDRLLSYIASKGMTKSAFGTSIGASKSFVDAIRSSISPEKIDKINEVYPDLNILWLLTGRQQMLVNNICGDMVQQNGCIESVKKVVGNISTTNTTNYFSGNGEKEDNIMNAMNKKLNIISEMSRSLLDRIVVLRPNWMSGIN